jgi:hypothetical protein
MVIPPVISYDHFTPIFAYWFNFIAKLKYLLSLPYLMMVKFTRNITPQNQAIAGQRNYLQCKSDFTGKTTSKNPRVAIRLHFVVVNMSEDRPPA